MPDFTHALNSGRVLVMDGAMGTQLQSAGIAANECYEAWNLIYPDRVRAIHTAYVEAGAEVILANTFQANAAVLAPHHRANDLTAIIGEGLALARAALAGRGWLLADIGPLGATDHPGMRRIFDTCREADGVLLETFSDPGEVEVLLHIGRDSLGPTAPILVSFTFDGATTFRNATPEKCAEAATSMGATAIGVNCGRDLDVGVCAEILSRYRAETGLPLFAQPNAGTPTANHVYPRSAEQMAKELPRLLEAGAVMVGGCCGTTPQHIRAFREVVDAWNRRSDFQSVRTV